MASSSSKPSCFQCDATTSDYFRDGWKLRSGEFAQLCHRCASIYEVGRFCETFHLDDDGWRDCQSCGKLVHCGCVVSCDAYLLLDIGGVICVECSKMNFLQARNRCYAPEVQSNTIDVPDVANRIGIEPHYWPRGTDSEMQCISEIPPNSVVNPLFEKLLSASDTDRKLGRIVIPKKCAEIFFPKVSDPRGTLLNIMDTEGKGWDFHLRYRPNNGNRTFFLEGLSDFMISKNLKAGDTVMFYRVEPGGKMVMGLRKTSMEKPPLQARNRYYAPEVGPNTCADLETQCVSEIPKSLLNPLFEKVLTPSDADRKFGRIVIPKKCAESYFPKVCDPQGSLLNILDTEGKGWDLHFRCWPNSRIYVLGGLCDFMISKNVKAGDTVIFHRVEPSGKMVMGLRKTSIEKPLLQASA